MFLAFPHGEASAQLGKDAQKCVNEINKNFEKVAKAQAGDISKCTKDAGKGKLTTSYSECLTSDPKGKVLKATGKLTSKVGDKCSEGDPAFPLIDTSDTGSMNERAKEKELLLIAVLLGTDLDGAIVLADKLVSGSKDDAKCQASLVKQMYKCQSAKLKSFNACKKDGLKGKSGDPFSSALELQDACLGTGTAGIPDGKGKIAKDCGTKLTSTTGKCTDTGIFPGCGDVGAADLAKCVDEIVECQVCVALNELDGLKRDCDPFDDGLDNESCPVCGNARVEFPEQCDDGNQTNEDGCSSVCLSEECGDGVTQTALGEECDDSNQLDGDGCSSTCLLEFCGDGIVQPTLDEHCDPPTSLCVDATTCDSSCRCPDAIDAHICLLDVDAFCVGDDPNGEPYVSQSCTDPITHSDCAPGPPTARCIQNSHLVIHTEILSPTLTLPLTGRLDLDCGAIDPATGKATCACELISVEDIVVPGIGAVCISPGNDPCPAGEIDCDGGNALDAQEIHDHNVGPAASLLDPNQFPVGFCGLVDLDNGHDECVEMCHTYCASLPGNFVRFASGCEGFCVEGSRHALPCEFDSECPQGACPGGDPVAHSGFCNCTCLEVAGAASRSGGLQCNIRAGLEIEQAAPCDGLDVTTTSLKLCVPLTTESSMGELLQANSGTGTIGPLSDLGAPISCAALTADNSAGLEMVATISFIDSALGDLGVQFQVVCD